MKNLKLLIIILIMFTIGIGAVMIVLNMQKNESNEVKNNSKIYGSPIEKNETENLANENVVDAEAPKMTFNTSVQEITSSSMLYSISNNINKYFNYIKSGNVQAVNELGGNTLYTIQSNANIKYVVKKAYSSGNEFMTKYYTYGVLTIASGNYEVTEQEIYMVVYLTAENKGYKLQTITNEEFLDIKELTLDEKVEISQGTYNVYEYEHIDNVDLMEIYLKDFIFRVYANPEKGYNLLNESYRNKRFGSVEEFVKYVIEKQEQLKNINIVQYNVDLNDNYKIYSGTDEYGNYYNIKEVAYMQYEVMLDSYTMEDYSNVTSKEEQIEKSVQKFILMLNSADYKNAYNLLEPTFKETNFPTEQDFINYIKNNWYKRNLVASKKATEEGICNVTIKETLSTRSNKMEKQFKVKILDEDLNFYIEFNV